MGDFWDYRVLTVTKKMKAIHLILILFMLLFSIKITDAKPFSYKESEFLLSCRPSCEKDASQLGFSVLEGKRRCDCYCRVIFKNISDSDVEYFKKYRSYSPSTITVVQEAMNQCIFRGR